MFKLKRHMIHAPVPPIVTPSFTVQNINNNNSNNVNSNNNNAKYEYIYLPELEQMPPSQSCQLNSDISLTPKSSDVTVTTTSV